jgi:hypothetical protein
VTPVEESVRDKKKAEASLWDIFIFLLLVDRDDEAFNNPPAEKSSTEVVPEVAMVVLEEEPGRPPRDLETEIHSSVTEEKEGEAAGGRSRRGIALRGALSDLV